MTTGEQLLADAVSLMSSGGTWTIPPEKQGAADAWVERMRAFVADQQRHARDAK